MLVFNAANCSVTSDESLDVGGLLGVGGPTADADNDMITNTSYVSADSAPKPAQPKKGIAKRTERKGSVYDGFGGDDAPAADTANNDGENSMGGK